MSAKQTNPTPISSLGEALAQAVTTYDEIGVDDEGYRHYVSDDGTTVVVVNGEPEYDVRKEAERVERLGERTLSDWIRFVHRSRSWQSLSPVGIEAVLGSED